MKKIIAAALCAVSAGIVLNEHQVHACTTLLVGKDATSDGSTIIARNEDEGVSWAKHFVVHQATNDGPTHYVSKGTGFTINLPAKQKRWTATPDWTPKYGPFSEDGVNSSNVAMSATETGDSNSTVQKDDPWVKNGISEDSMINVVLPFINSPRQGVERLGEIVNKYGANSGAVGGIIFSNKNSIWYMEIGSGHQWVAERVPNNEYAVIPNTLVIGNINWNDHKDFMYSPTLKSFLKKNHLWNGQGQFNWAKTFGPNPNSPVNKTYNWPRMWLGQHILTPSDKQSITSTNFKLFMKPDRKVTLPMVKEVLSSYYQGTQYNDRGKMVGPYRPIGCAMEVESHIIQMRQNEPYALTPIQWLCMATPVTGVYIPFFTDINNTPAAYQKGTDQFTPGSAYWTYELTWDLSNAYLNPKTGFNQTFSKYIAPVRDKVQNQLYTNVNKVDTDVRANGYTGSQLSEFLTQQNADNANYALGQYNSLNTQLLTNLGNDTPFMNWSGNHPNA